MERLARIACGLMIVFLCAGCAHSTAKRITEPVDAAAVIRAIQAHDAKMQSLDVTTAAELSLVDDKPGGTMTEVWRMKGKKEFLSTTIDSVGTVNTSAFDGIEIRGLTATKEQGNFAEIMPSTYAKFSLNAHQPHGFTARYLWERRLIHALEAGSVTVDQKLAVYEGARCFVLLGRMMTKASDGADAMWVKVLLDVDRGCMPLYVEAYHQNPDGKVVTRNILDQYVLQQVQPGVWFPKSLRQQCLMLSEAGVWESKTVNRIRVTQIKVNTVSEDQLALEFPPGTQVDDFRRSILFPARFVVDATTAK